MGGGLAGFGVGWLLGSFVPNYYRNVFVGGRDPSFDPVAVGMGSGLTQGLMLGFVAGIAVAWITAWRETKKQ
ncbi:MAG: hypothetical protein ABL949_06495 [Fimbriimonadaceae bacterium]